MTLTTICNVTLFDGRSFHPHSSVTFGSDTGLIVSVSKSGSPYSTSAEGDNAIASSAIIDGTGHTLLPGLIDAHIHAYDLHLPPGTFNSAVRYNPLKCGITTLCDMHSDLPSVAKLRAEIREDLEQARAKGPDGRVRMADLKSSLFGATIEGGWPKPIALAGNPSEELKSLISTWPNVTVDNASDFVKDHKANGADYIKLMQENCCSLALPTNSIPIATPELQATVVNAAHKEGLIAVGHALSMDSTEILLDAGADGLTHTFIDQPPSDTLVEKYKRSNAFVIPTLGVLASLTGEEQDLRQKFAEVAQRKGIIDDSARETMLSALDMKAPSAQLQFAYDTVRRLKSSGIDVVAGTDSVAGIKGMAIGPSLWMELDMYVSKCGMRVAEALNAATETSARRFGFQDRGFVREGMRADLVLVKGSRLVDELQFLWEGEGIVGVWKNGIKAE